MTIRGPILQLFLLTVALLLLAGCAGQVQPAANSAEQTTSSPGTGPQVSRAAQAAGELKLPAVERTSDGGGVTVKVKPAGASGGQLLFEVVLDTHSVELAYDLVTLASLKDEQGRTYRATGWQGGKGGHHVSGVLAVAAPDDGVKSLELELRDIAGVASRTFRWDVG